MFEKARLKLTGWYLAIIMTISLSFSVVIYMGVNTELIRIGEIQKERQDRFDSISSFLLQNGLPIPSEVLSLDSETVEQARLRIISTLGLINISILVVSGLGGYFLAAQTLDPISKMVKRQKEFVGNASHELRTPLTALKTEIEVALRDKKMGVKELKNLLKSNLEEVNSMQKLSNNLLELHRYESADINVDVGKVDLAKAVSTAIKKVEPAAVKKKVKIDTKLSDVKVRGNENALIELSTILIENAIKYSGKSKRIEVNTKSRGTLEVRDFGLGISKEDLPHIFERFYRSEHSRSKEKIGGYGLGLSIAKHIVSRLGGKIRVESKVGQGTTFKVQLPAT